MFSLALAPCPSFPAKSAAQPVRCPSAGRCKILCTRLGGAAGGELLDTSALTRLRFSCADQDRISDFDVKLMDIDSEHLGIPDTEYKATVKMSAAEFQRIMRDLATIGDTVTIACTKEAVKFSVEGDIGSGNVLCRHNATVDKDEQPTIIELEEPVSLNFALRYLNHFAKATPLSESVTLCMSPDVPLVTEYKIGDMGNIRYYLAPKIDEGN